jgi:hypothetical protein
MRPEATSVCGLTLLVYAALSYKCMRPEATSVCHLWHSAICYLDCESVSLSYIYIYMYTYVHTYIHTYKTHRSVSENSPFKHCFRSSLSNCSKNNVWPMRRKIWFTSRHIKRFSYTCYHTFRAWIFFCTTSEKVLKKVWTWCVGSKSRVYHTLPPILNNSTRKKTGKPLGKIEWWKHLRWGILCSDFILARGTVEQREISTIETAWRWFTRTLTHGKDALEKWKMLRFSSKAGTSHIRIFWYLPS